MPSPFPSATSPEFGPAYWYLLVLCVLWYSVIFAFRSTFSIKYFQHAHGLDLAAAGAINAYVFLAALFATPAFGWLCDRIGRYAPILAFGALLLPIAIASWRCRTDRWGRHRADRHQLLAGAGRDVAADGEARAGELARHGARPDVGRAERRHRPARISSPAGSTTPTAPARRIPAGYQPMMWYFFLSSAAGFCFALALWNQAGRRRHEAPPTDQAAVPAPVG